MERLREAAAGEGESRGASPVFSRHPLVCAEKCSQPYPTLSPVASLSRPYPPPDQTRPRAGPGLSAGGAGVYRGAGGPGRPRAEGVQYPTDPVPKPKETK